MPSWGNTTALAFPPIVKCRYTPPFSLLEFLAIDSQSSLNSDWRPSEISLKTQGTCKVGCEERGHYSRNVYLNPLSHIMHVTPSHSRMDLIPPPCDRGVCCGSPVIYFCLFCVCGLFCFVFLRFFFLGIYYEVYVYISLLFLVFFQCNNSKKKINSLPDRFEQSLD